MSQNIDNPANIKNITLILNNRDVPEELHDVEVERNFLAAVKPTQEHIANPDVVLVNEVNTILQSNAEAANSPSTSSAYETIDPDKLINSAFSDGSSGSGGSTASDSPEPYRGVAMGNDNYSTALQMPANMPSTVPLNAPQFSFGGGSSHTGNSHTPSTSHLNTSSTSLYSYAAEPETTTVPRIPVDELLADISSFRQELTTNDINIDDIPQVTERHSYQEILSIRNVLKHKVDRIIAGSLGETFLIEGAKMIGTIFNGERKIGPFRPHLAGWDATVRNKIARHRSSVANLSQGVLSTVGLNSDRSIILELLLSAVAYSNMHSKKSLARDRYAEAAENLRGI